VDQVVGKIDLIEGQAEDGFVPACRCDHQDDESGNVPSRGVIRARRFGCGDGFSCPSRAD
jgi:hypothetical protein